MSHLIHGSQWNRRRMVMLNPVTAEEACSAYAAGETICVAGGPEPLRGKVPGSGTANGDHPAAWSLVAATAPTSDSPRGFVHVSFYDVWGQEKEWRSFVQEEDGRLFLREAREYDHDDPTDLDAAWTSCTEHLFRPDGYSSEVVRASLPDGTHDVRMTEYSGGDFSGHHEPAPAFGEWAGVLRRQR